MTETLNFGRKAAQSGQTKGLVVFLHGYGADGADLLGLADVLGGHLPDLAFVAPDAPDKLATTAFGRQWFSIPRFDGSSPAEAEAGLQRSTLILNAFLDARLADEGLCPDRMVLVGFSQGAMMSLQVAPRREKPVAGVVAISGMLIAPERLANEALVKPPVLLMHGDHDEVVPFGEMARAGNALVAAGFETYGHVMAGSGHGIAPDGLQVMAQFLAERLD